METVESMETTESTGAETEAAPENPEAPEQSTQESEGGEGAHSFFTDEYIPSESELMGEEEGGETGEEEESQETPPAESSETKPETKPEEGDAEPEKPEAAAKPPKGFVTLQALHDERYKRQGAIQQLTEAQARIAEMESLLNDIGSRKPGENDDLKDFKVLSQEEVDELAEDDPAEAAKYLSRLNRFHAKEMREKDIARAQAEASRNKKALIDDAMREIQTAVPGIYDAQNDIGVKLTEFAEQNGLTKDVIRVISDPATVIIPAGSSQPIVLGRGAAQVVSLINKLYHATKSADPETIRGHIEKEVREKVVAEFTKKLKQGGRQVVSLGEAPSLTESDLQSVPLDEAAWEKMSEEDRRRALGG